MTPNGNKMLEKLMKSNDVLFFEDLMTYTMLTRKLEKGRTKKYPTFRNGYMGYAVNTTMTLRDLLMDALVFAKKVKELAMQDRNFLPDFFK